MSRLSSTLNSMANFACYLAPGSWRGIQVDAARLVAHRGAHGPGLAQENTLAAFDLCLSAGVWGIECDIRLTRDDQPVIIHDPDCGRNFGLPDLEIATTDFAVLRAAVPEVPHLSEMLERYAGQMHLMLEIKESGADRPALPRVIHDALSALEPERDYHLLSLLPEGLEVFSEIPEGAKVDVAWFNTADTIKRNMALKHGGMGGSLALITTPRLRRLQASGKRVGTGFVETPAALRREVNRGVDWIFTDCVLRLQPLLSSGGKPS